MHLCRFVHALTGCINWGLGGGVGHALMEEIELATDMRYAPDVKLQGAARSPALQDYGLLMLERRTVAHLF